MGSEAQSAQFSHLVVDENELKSIKVTIRRRNISNPDTTGPLSRSLEDPASLVIHYRPDKGVRPIFDRKDVVVNKESQEESAISASTYQETTKPRDRSLPGGYARTKTPPRDCQHRHSRSPPGHRSCGIERKRSRSPPPKVSEKARSPPKYRGPAERRRSRSPPPPRRNSRGRSRSYSPHHRSRYSRSPHQRKERRYENSRRRSPRRSRSPRRRYTPERHAPTRMPNQYFEGAQLWIPNPMVQPPFIPPGAFPYPFTPGMLQPMFPPRRPFRPTIVYNHSTRPKGLAPAIIKRDESENKVTSTEKKHD